MQPSKYTNGSTTQLLFTGSGAIDGIMVNSHSSGTIKLWDNTSAAGSVILNTITFAAGPQILSFPKGISFYTGLFITVGGTIDYTILTAPR